MQVLGDLEKRLRLRLVTSEFEIITWLFCNGPTPSRDLARHTKASIANFQLIVRRLKDDGVVVTNLGDQDRRVREYDLSPKIRGEINGIIREYGFDGRALIAFFRDGLLTAA